MIRIETPSLTKTISGTDTNNPFILDFHKARHTLLAILAATEGLYCRDFGSSGHTFSYYTAGSLEIHVPMGTEQEKFKMNYFLTAIMDLNLLDALVFHYDTDYEQDWVQSFLEKYRDLKYPKFVSEGD